MTFPFPVRRGDVLQADVGHGTHYYVVISNDTRNSVGATFLGARITSKAKYAHSPTTAAITAQDGQTCQQPTGEPMMGWVQADRIVEVPPPGAYRPAGAPVPALHHLGRLSGATMADVDRALRVAVF